MEREFRSYFTLFLTLFIDPHGWGRVAGTATGFQEVEGEVAGYFYALKNNNSNL
jgi:hypothetical protein